MNQPKRAWPLVVLACGSFIPGLGFFIAAAALSWALLSDRPRARLAIILSATGGALHLGAGAVLFVQGARSGEFARSQATLARRDLDRLVLELEKYRNGKGQYPPDLRTLVGTPLPLGMINIQDHTAGVFRPRQYEYRLAPDGSAYDLFSSGRDGIAGTADDLRPGLPDSALATTGYRPR